MCFNLRQLEETGGHESGEGEGLKTLRSGVELLGMENAVQTKAEGLADMQKAERELVHYLPLAAL